MREDAFGSGLVDLLVLGVIAAGPTYGYAIRQAIAAAGIDGVREATVYASLKRLDDRRLLRSWSVVADNGKARKYYELTDDGTEALRREQANWKRLRDTVDEVLGNGGQG